MLSYEIATTQFGFLPPLIGIFFTYMILEYSRKQKQYDEFKPSWYFSLVFLVFAEQISPDPSGATKSTEPVTTQSGAIPGKPSPTLLERLFGAKE